MSKSKGIKYIDQYRDEFYKDSTIGYVIMDGNIFCYTLEDAVRAYGVKVYGATAIAENRDGYPVKIHRSNRFKRDVLMLYTEDDGKTLRYGGISFQYVYSHGGNTHLDTEGCILVANNKGEGKIHGTAEKMLFEVVKEWIDAGYEVKWRIFNIV